MRRREVVVGGVLAATACAPPPRPNTDPSPIPLDRIELFADALDRPEGVVSTPSGRLIVSAAHAACTMVEPNGTRIAVGRAHHANGLAMDAQGRLIIANYGLIDGVPGSLQRLNLDTGDIETLASEIAGRAFTSSNFPAIGARNDIYCTHTQWSDPRNIGATDPQGFVYRVDARGTVSVVCDGLRMANGLCFSADFSQMFVAQTAAANVIRFERNSDGGYANPRQWGPQLGEAPDNLRAESIPALSDEARSRLGHVDGLALDQAGNLWVTQPFANRVSVITPDERHLVIVDDTQRAKFNMITSIAFGGPDLRDVYLTSMWTNQVWRARVQIPGLPLPHWRALL
jgi:gluconolactonase